MAMERTEAYDLSLFETRPVTGTAVPKPKQDVPVRHDNVIHLPEPEPTVMHATAAAPCARWAFSRRY